mgnify:FL=1
MRLTADNKKTIHDKIAPVINEIIGGGAEIEEVVDYLLDCLDCDEAQRMRTALHYRVEDYISVPQYAELHDKNPSGVRARATKGDFESAIKIEGIGWIINAREPYPDDGRIRHGKYRGQRQWTQD